MLLSELSPLAPLANAMPQARYTSKSLCTDEQFQSVCVLMKFFKEGSCHLCDERVIAGTLQTRFAR